MNHDASSSDSIASGIPCHKILGVSPWNVVLLLVLGLLINLVDDFITGLHCLNPEKSRSYVFLIVLALGVGSAFFSGSPTGRHCRFLAISTFAWLAALSVLFYVWGVSWIIYPRLLGAVYCLRTAITQEQLNRFRSDPHWQTEPTGPVTGRTVLELMPPELARSVSLRRFAISSWYASSTDNTNCMNLLIRLDWPPNTPLVLISSSTCNESPTLEIEDLGWETFGVDPVARVRKIGIEVLDGMTLYYTSSVGSLPFPMSWGR